MSRTAIPNEETIAPARRPHRGALSSCVLRHQGDERLVMLTRAGSERAFAEIMRRYQRPLYMYCLQLLGAGRAEDAVQQAFLKAFVALRDGAGREIALRPWLYRIARNCSIDLLRKHDADHDELDPEYEDMPQALAPALLEQKEELANLVAAILALPEGQRRALTLRELEGRSYGEISAALGHTDSGVRQLIFRARTALRNLAAVAFPLGSVRSRLLGQVGPGPADPHHVAAAASLSPAGSGGTFETLGSILAATVTLAAGGGAAASAHDPAPGPAPIQAYVAAPAVLAPVTDGQLLKLSATRASGRGHRSGGAGAATPTSPALAPSLDPTAASPIVVAPAPFAPPAAPSAAPLPESAVTPAPAAGPSPSATGAGGDGTEPRSQALNVTGTPASTGAPKAGPALPPTIVGKIPAKGASGPSGAIAPATGGGAKQVKPAKPLLPAKPGAPAKPVLVPTKSLKPVKPPKAPAVPKAPKLPSAIR
jgi:RNA polymerase sigma factor (sigma-70 family)